jgi:predicted  nucleic acid-binding Zn-ribbon protein
MFLYKNNQNMNNNSFLNSKSNTSTIVNAIQQLGQQIDDKFEKLDKTNNSFLNSKSNTSTIVNAIQQLGQQINDKFEKIDKKLDKTLQFSLERITNLENKSVNLDKSVELLVTNSVHDWLKNFATRNEFRMTVKTGSKFIKNWKKYNDDELITELDGCYILTNSKSNVKYSDTDNKLKEKNKVLESLERQLKKYESLNTLDLQKNNKLSKLTQKHRELQKELNSAVVDDVLNEILDEIDDEISEHKPSRVLCIVESKVFVRNEDIDYQVKKIKQLLDYIFNVKLLNLFEKDKQKINFISNWKNWNKSFIQVNKSMNLLFEGLLFFIGGNFMVEKEIQTKVDEANLSIIEYLKSKVQTLEEKMKINDIFREFNEIEYNFYKYILIETFTKNVGARILLVQNNTQKVNVRDV